MIEVINVIEQCNDHNFQPRPDVIHSIWVHRVGIDLVWQRHLGTEPIEICRRFREDPKVACYTGGENPYTIFIGEQGEVWQSLPLSEVGPHARRFSRRGLGVAVIADPRVAPLHHPQRFALITLLAELLPMFLLGPDRIFGHTEVKGASGDSNKQCPGKLLNMDNVRDDAIKTARRAASRCLALSGWTL